MEDEKTMNEGEPQEFWGEAKCGIWVSDLGNSKDQITQYRGRNVIRKTVTIKKKVKIKGVEKTLTKEIQKRYQVARLVLECFPHQEAYQDEGLGNHKGKGIVVWIDKNELNDRAEMAWKALAGQKNKWRTGAEKKAIEELGLTETWSEYYASIKK